MTTDERKYIDDLEALYSSIAARHNAQVDYIAGLREANHKLAGLVTFWSFSTGFFAFTTVVLMGYIIKGNL